MKKKMCIKTVKVSGKGQIAIPRQVQRDLNIKKGDEFILVTKDNKILLEKAEELFDDFEEDIDWLKASESSLSKLWDNKDDDIWEEYLK